MTTPVVTAYYYVFYRLRGWFKALADDGAHDWKAIVAISVMQGIVGYSLVILVGSLLGTFLLRPDTRIDAALAAIGLPLLNYFLLLHKSRWRRYESRFGRHSALKRRWLGVLVVVSGLAILGLFIASLFTIEPAT